MLCLNIYPLAFSIDLCLLKLNVRLLKLSVRKMLNRITSSIATCTIFGFIITCCPPLYRTERVIAQTSLVQDEISKLRSEVSKQGKSSEDVNRAMRDKFPKSSFPYYEPANGCTNPADLSNWNRVFEGACNNHDICYTTPGNTKELCDSQMSRAMSKVCASMPNFSREVSCSTAADRYDYGVSTFIAKRAYSTAQEQQRQYIKSIYAWLSGIAGIWNSTEGTITFKQSGSNISATYTQDNGAIEGSISDNILTGYWIEDGSLRRCSIPRNGRYHWGKIRFIFKDSSFRGLWSYCDREPNMRWRGVKLSS